MQNIAYSNSTHISYMTKYVAKAVFTGVFFIATKAILIVRIYNIWCSEERYL